MPSTRVAFMGIAIVWFLVFALLLTRVPETPTRAPGDIEAFVVPPTSREGGRGGDLTQRRHTATEVPEYGEPEGSGGAPSAWDEGRGGVWSLRDAESTNGMNWLDKCNLIVEKNRNYLSQARGTADLPVTLVSGLFDLGRGDLNNDFKRPFSYYVEQFEVFLRYQHPKVIFVEERYWEPLYRPLVEKHHSEAAPIHVIFKSVEEVRQEFPFYAALDAIRVSDAWRFRTGVNGWLAQSPQATLPLYDPMVMSKLPWVRHVARMNPFGSQAFLWIDGGHRCNDPAGLTEEKMDFLRERMDRLLVTYFDYEPATEIHGFEKSAFLAYLGVEEEPGKRPQIIVGRGGIFGGSREHLEVATLVYTEMLRATLKKGYLGTEENLFSMLYYRFPELVHDYRNGDGGNCAIFSEAVHGPPPKKAVWSEYMEEFGYLLRGCECAYEEDGWSCRDGMGEQCDRYVTPTYLTRADDQFVCQLIETNYCSVRCEGETVWWEGHSCNEGEPCPPPAYEYVPKKEIDP